MSEENISHRWNKKLFHYLMSKNDKKAYRVLNYIERLLILISTVTGCVSISAFASLVGIAIGITICKVGLKCIKNTKSKNSEFVQTKNGRIMLLPKCAVCDRKNKNRLKDKKFEDY